MSAKASPSTAWRANRDQDALASMTRSHQRLHHLYEISRLFASFESVEETFDPVLALAARTLPLRTAMLIEAADGRSRMIVWSAMGQSSEALEPARAHVQAAYAYLVGSLPAVSSARVEEVRMTALPRQESAGESPNAPEREESLGKRLIVIPLVVARRPPFGALQLEGDRPLDEDDLVFVNAVANQLAIALERDRTWRRDLTRREEAERGRTLAETSRTEYEALARENARLYAQAKHAVEMRDQTLAIVSHDLRNPLGIILMAAAGLAKRAIPDERRLGLPETVGRIERAAMRMLRLIEDLLDFASIEAGNLALSRQLEAPTSMVDEALAAFEDLTKARGLRLTAVVAPELPDVDCDRDRILQVLSNLMSNAIEAAGEGGGVALSVEAKEEELWFAVSDTGPGISEADMRHLFERYWRGGDARYTGAGLGLAIASGIVSAHGGRIWVESEIGRGATFLFTIPAVKARKPRLDDAG